MIPDPFNPAPGGADPLITGFYLVRRQGRIDVPVRIWFGAPLDPDSGEEMDRSPRWQIQIGLALLEHEPMRIGGIWIQNLDDLWPACARQPIDEAEWRYRVERAAWAEQYDPLDAHGTIGGRVDHLTCRLP